MGNITRRSPGKEIRHEFAGRGRGRWRLWGGLRGRAVKLWAYEEKKRGRKLRREKGVKGPNRRFRVMEKGKMSVFGDLVNGGGE